VGTRMAEALDALRCAVLLTNEHGAILHANCVAEYMLDKAGPISKRARRPATDSSISGV
jgi:nitrogen-specific signal transduction histidine kinase